MSYRVFWEPCDAGHWRHVGRDGNRQLTSSRRHKREDVAVLTSYSRSGHVPELSLPRTWWHQRTRPGNMFSSSSSCRRNILRGPSWTWNIWQNLNTCLWKLEQLPLGCETYKIIVNAHIFIKIDIVHIKYKNWMTCLCINRVGIPNNSMETPQVNNLAIKLFCWLC